MTDYSKWKVNDLKAELKRRGISQSNLRVKQNFIDKLLEADAGGQTGEATEEAPVAPDEPTDTQDTVEQEKEQQSIESEQRAERPTPDVPPQEHKPEERQQEGEPKWEHGQEPDARNGDVKAREEPNAAEPTAEEATRGEDVAEAKREEPMMDVVSQERPEKQSQEETWEEPSEETQKAPEEAQPIEEPAPQPQPENEATAQPVEQAPGDAVPQEFAPAVREPEGAEPTASIDQGTPSAKAPEVSAKLPAALPTEEVIEDKRKRKRRSQSPITTPEALANKKTKAQDETPRVMLPEDQEGLSTEEQLVKDQLSRPEAKETQDGVPTSGPEEPRSKRGAPPKQDARFKGLFAGAEREQARPASPPADTEMKDAEVEPAIHPATPALYIGGLMRPLQPGTLRNHLISLASAPGTPSNADVVAAYFLDAIKTHCLVSFTSVSAASRVRSALHGTVWPNERNRKTLFVDFIPEQKVQEWIDTEEKSQQRGGPKPRWEVKYDRTDDGVEAVLKEFDPKGTAGNPPPRKESSAHDVPRAPPLGPRADRERLASQSGPPRPPPQAESRPSQPGQGFKPLDELFKSTTVKPKLYYLPVSREMADRRLDRFDDLLRKGEYPRRGGDETRRISFEDGDLFVDNGPEFAGGGRGRRRDRGRGRGGGGGFGDSWRA